MTMAMVMGAYFCFILFPQMDSACNDVMIWCTGILKRKLRTKRWTACDITLLSRAPARSCHSSCRTRSNLRLPLQRVIHSNTRNQSVSRISYYSSRLFCKPDPTLFIPFSSVPFSPESCFDTSSHTSFDTSSSAHIYSYTGPTESDRGRLPEI